jgi:hypothetical protein
MLRPHRSKSTSVENLRLRYYLTQTAPQPRLAAATAGMETAAKQTTTASGDIVKLIRKLRWIGLEEKAEQLEKELLQHAVTDTVVSVQNETD